MGKFSQYYLVYLNLGINWILFRLIYYLKRKLRIFVFLSYINQIKRNYNYLYFYSNQDVKNTANNIILQNRHTKYTSSTFPFKTINTVEEAEEILKGRFSFFSNKSVEMNFPPNWSKTEDIFRKTKDIHWSLLSDFQYGDIKKIWEINRFSFVYSLCRSYYITNDDRYALCFWNLVEDWELNNKVDHGINWKCGQEISIRIIAWSYALFCFWNNKHTTKIRINIIQNLFCSHGYRIASNLKYSEQQYNNHSLSEAIGLWTISVLWPGLKESPKWKKIGNNMLLKQINELVYDDGSFSQHSVNYHRFYMHLVIWYISLSLANNEKVNQTLKQSLEKSSIWLKTLIVGSEGEVPNYGANDGTLLFHLTNCKYTDFRPVIQTSEIILNKKKYFNDGPWDEEAYWLSNINLNSLKNIRTCNDNANYVNQSYKRLSSNNSFLFVNSPAYYLHRMNQADMLHIDYWYKGTNLLIDPGTYSYNQPDPWNNSLYKSSVHNTITINEEDHSERVSRFLLLPWSKSLFNVDVNKDNNKNTYIFKSNSVSQKYKITHIRKIINISKDQWQISDRLVTDQNLKWEINWLIKDLNYKIEVKNNKILGLTFSLKNELFMMDFSPAINKEQLIINRASNNSIYGWSSNYYLTKKPAISLKIRLNTINECVFTTSLRHQ